MDDFTIDSVPMGASGSGEGDDLFMSIPDAFSDPIYMLSLVILSVIIVLFVMAMMDAGPLAKPLSSVKTALTGSS